MTPKRSVFYSLIGVLFTTPIQLENGVYMYLLMISNLYALIIPQNICIIYIL